MTTTMDELQTALQKAADAAYGDSNDTEIESLQEALECALDLLGVPMPEGRERCDGCGEPTEHEKVDEHCTGHHCYECIDECKDCGPAARESDAADTALAMAKEQYP